MAYSDGESVINLIDSSSEEDDNNSYCQPNDHDDHVGSTSLACSKQLQPMRQSRRLQTAKKRTHGERHDNTKYDDCRSGTKKRGRNDGELVFSSDDGEDISLVFGERAIDNTPALLTATVSCDNLDDPLSNRVVQTKSVSAATATSIKKNSKSTTTYLKARINGVKKRSFDLSSIPTSQTIVTGRTIKPMGPAWQSHWPALREFMQNTIDHLELLNPITGRRHEALTLEMTKGTGTRSSSANSSAANSSTSSALATLKFKCGTDDICTITIPSKDEVIIEQMYTFPLPPRALDTGVPDSTKNSADVAGGFGDGFKTAAVAILALCNRKTKTAKTKTKNCRSANNMKPNIEWNFYSGGQHIVWKFVGETREAVSTFEECRVLTVQIDRSKQTKSQTYDNDDIMVQTIKAADIGQSFLDLALPRLVVFWDLNEGGDSCDDDALPLRSKNRGRHFLAPASHQPLIANGIFGTNLRPEAGVYVRGIYVRKPKIANTLMCFFGNQLEVTGRDRNDVDEDELLDAVMHLFKNCIDDEYLRRLMMPLCGQRANAAVVDANDEEIDGQAAISSRRHTSKTNRQRQRANVKSISGSWLLQSPRFLNRILEQHKDFILHRILRVPRNAICVSSKTTKCKDPFVQWASTYLARRGAPLYPIEKGANRCLFQEVSQDELTLRCVEFLKRDLNSSTLRTASDEEETVSIKKLHAAFKSLLSFLCPQRGRAAPNIYFSPEVPLAFVHDRDIYIPKPRTLTRDLVVKVLNVCQCRLEHADGTRFSCLMQAVFEVLSPSIGSGNGVNASLTVNDIDRVVIRSKNVLKETKEFLDPRRRNGVQTNQDKDKNDDNNDVFPTQSTPSSTNTTSPFVEDLCSPIGHTPNNTLTRKRKSKSGSNHQERLRQRQHITNAQYLQEQIDLAGSVNRHKRNTGSNPHVLDSIIPEADFGQDDGGDDDTCLRPSSQLKPVPCEIGLGGGTMHCDTIAESAIIHNTLSEDQKARIVTLRNTLNDAIALVERGIPSVSKLLPRIREGYDTANDTYEAFCDGTYIIVNLHSYMYKITVGSAPPKTLIHDFVVMITHELAHFLEPRMGHNAVWRDTHMRMMMEVMVVLSSSSLSSST